jgi:hypothetical protein
VCRRPNCPLTHRAKQRMGRIVRGSDCHSQRLDPLLRGRIERFGCGRTVRPLWGRIVSIWKRLWGESLQCRMVRVRVSQCPTGGWRNRQGTGFHAHYVYKDNVSPCRWTLLLSISTQINVGQNLMYIRMQWSGIFLRILTNTESVMYAKLDLKV